LSKKVKEISITVTNSPWQGLQATVESGSEP
jgi:hypothetical protein